MRTFFTALVVLLVCLAGTRAPAAELSVWALQADMRAAIGAPDTSLPPGSIAYNRLNGTLLIACGGSKASILEWQRGSSTGTVLVPHDNWGTQGPPSPLSCTFVPARWSYMVGDGGEDNVILEVQPGVAGQTPTVYLTCLPPTFPAGGLPVDNTYGYYKNQWTGLDQTVNRFALDGSGTESVYVPYTAFQALFSSGPSRQFVIDSAGDIIVSARTSSAYKANRGLYRWDEAAEELVPIVRLAEITAHTGASSMIVYGLTIDALDNMYFFDIYAAAILKITPDGRVSTLLTTVEIRDFMGDPEMAVWVDNLAVANNLLVFTTGTVSGHVLAMRLPLDVETATIPGSDYEVDGPTYTYEIGKFEITNAQYCMFLNDAEAAQQADPNDPRCTNMWIDSFNGDVYMTDVTVYPPGSEWYDRTLYKTSDIPDSKIKYDIIAPPGNRFYVLDGFDHHPVGTVTWFGAAKFCNWLTIDQGLDASQICYHEGSSKHDWYATTASDWQNQGLLDDERLDLVRNYRGFRLPMDGVNYDNGGPGVAHSWNMDANPYNEWYKAAAFDPQAPDTVRSGPGENEEAQPDHWLYGFGADVLGDADANFSASGDPFAETTPVGWYNGVNQLTDGTPTNDTRNRYGLYDMCGNMSEWINDTALQHPWSSTFRGTRGGRWVNADPAWLTNSVRNITTARYYAENSVGFRVARSTGFGDFEGDGDVDYTDYAFLASALTGPVDTVAPGMGLEACDFDGNQHVDLRDFGAFQAVFGQAP